MALTGQSSCFINRPIRLNYYICLPELCKAPGSSYIKEVSMENRKAPRDLRGEVGRSTCGDNAKGKAASLVKILTGDCQGGGVDKSTTQA